MDGEAREWAFPSVFLEIKRFMRGSMRWWTNGGHGVVVRKYSRPYAVHGLGCVFEAMHLRLPMRWKPRSQECSNSKSRGL